MLSVIMLRLMHLKLKSWLVASIFLLFLEISTTNANNGQEIYSNFIYPRRRSSADGFSSQMQSRAVDTRIPLEIQENEPRGSVVGFIPTKIGYSYRFNEQPREFVLDSNTGEIKTNTVLDREQRDRYDLVVLSSQPTYPIEVRINVIDTNDNYPEFPESTIAVTFSENSQPGTRLLLDAATDKDIGINSVTDDYKIVSGNYDDKFRLAVTKNPSGDVTYLHLETTGKLDRETRGSYTLNISIRDGGKPPKNGYVQVNVTILDVNDSPPIFDHSDYIVSLNESVLPGTPVLQVMASDNDLGDNAKLTYYLSETESQFTVDPETGVILTTEHLSCPHQQSCLPTKPGINCPKSCVFTVFARDHGSPRQDGRTYVTVNLVDTNDHDPIIRFQYFPLTGTFATVDENAVNGSVVAAIYVVDMDEGLNGDTNIKIFSGNEMRHFRLENTPSFDIVRVNGILDREEISTYNLTIIATDKGTPPRTATAHLIIHVNDVNDAYPVFEKSEYSAVLSELVPIGTYVVSIRATDEDTGVNAQIYYDFVSGNARQWFRIDSISGLVTTQAFLDRELQGTIQLNVSARDGGPNPKWSYAELKVIILDENDEAPQFSREHINVTLSENSPPNTLVAMLTAIDNDQGTNGSVIYSLQSDVNQKYPNVFSLDTTTGQLTTKSKLDREIIDYYEINVVAKDQGTPQQSATATVSLFIEDVNDNRPEFYPKQYFIPIPEDTPIDTQIIKVLANDSDAGDNAIITYNLENDINEMFTIDSRTGIIKLRSNFRSTHKSLYRLVVSARDRDNAKSDEALIEIIKDNKMEELEFDSFAGYEFQIIEDFGVVNAKIGREVGRTQVIEKSKTDSNPIEYSIVFGDPNGNFDINSRSGIIRTAKLINREEISFYTLNIAVRAGLAYAKTTVNISILDLNDCAPTFAKENDEIKLSENAAVGQEVYLARARDKDSGVNSRITYNLTYNPDEQFRISESTGVLYLNRPILAEPETLITVEIFAKDGGLVSLSSKSTLNVRIEDRNDHTPVFDQTSYETSLSELTSVNTRFFALAASDADLGSNGRISYKIVEGNTDNNFGIFPDGYMYVKNSLDREEHDYYSLTVMCSDSGNPSRSSLVPVIIHVIDENDNAPQFTNSTFTFSIAENEPIDTFVGKLTANDRDIGRNAELIFTLSSIQNDFTIDTRNGFIKTDKKFDREALVQSTGQNYIMLEAVVSDNGVVRLKDTVKIKIYILDLNDNEPKFLRTPYKVQISEGSSIRTQLIRIYTVDIDEGLNGDVFYYIYGGNQDGKFAIDGSTGQITLVKTLDRESQSTYKLTVIAHDAALENRLSSNTTISIEILDENDNEPVFTQTNTQIKVNETTSVETELIQFRATDSDLGVNSQISFSITAGNRRDTFHIDSITGKLFLHRALDYEETTSYTLNITATDGGNPQLQTTIQFSVIVIDENDNPPSFPSTAIVRQIKEGIPVKTPIVTVTAEDPDSGINGKVIYSLINQEPSNNNRHFSINPATGVIFTLRDIDRETIDTFKLTILATDQALPESKRLSAEKICTVIVEDINDSVPMFVSMNAAILPQTNLHLTRNGAVIMNAFARDADSGTNGLVTYELVGGNSELFKVHRSTGAITLQKQFDNDNIELKYQLALKATDEAVQTERKSSDAYITLIAFGDNSSDSRPIFENRNLFGSVYENEPIGTNILTVVAHLYTASIEYYITNVTGNGRQVDRLFDIDSKLGVLSTATELDREAGVDAYEIEVYALALGGVPRTASTKVRSIIIVYFVLMKIGTSDSYLLFATKSNKVL